MTKESSRFDRSEMTWMMRSVSTVEASASEPLISLLGDGLACCPRCGQYRSHAAKDRFNIPLA